MVDNAGYIKGKLQEAGLNESQIFGIMTNLKAESGFDNTVHENYTGGGIDESGGYGIAQWTDPGRKQGLKDYAASQGTDVSDMDTQINYMLSEIDPDLLQRMGAADNNTAAGLFMREFERPADQSDSALNGRIVDYSSMAGIPVDTEAMAKSMESSDPFKQGILDNFDSYTNNVYSAQRDPVVVHEDYQPASAWEKFSTGFMDTATNTGVADVAQLLWGRIAHSDNFSVHPLTQDDLDYVKKNLSGNKDAQEYVLNHAVDRKELEWLVNQKQVDAKREALIERWNDGNIMTMANAGKLVGGLADPLNYVGFGEAYAGTKILARLGGEVYNMEKVAKYARLAALQGTTNVADMKMRESFGAEKFDMKDYAMTAALGVALGGLTGAVGDAFSHSIGKRTVMEDIALKADHAETQVIKHVADVGAVKEETKTLASKLHDESFGEKIESPLYKKYEAQGRVMAMSLGDAKRLVQENSGMVLPNDTKAFYVPNEDYTILVKDNVKPGEVDNLMAHEMGAHGDIKRIMGEERYNDLMDKVRTESSTKGTALYEARRAANSYDPEEILGYALEKDMLKGSMMDVIKNRLNRGYKEQGFDLKMSTSQIKDMLLQNADFAKEVADGVYRNPDGSTAFAGIKFSKDNAVNPELFAHLYSLEGTVSKDTQKELTAGIFSKPLQWAGKKVETGRIFGTPTGVMVNSMSNTMRKWGSRLTEDARGRGMGDVTITAEAHRQQILNQLMIPYVDYVKTRQSWIREMKGLKGMGAKSNMEFDKMAMTRYNERFGGNKANPLVDVHPAVEEAAGHLKAYREKQIEIGKMSASMIGHSGENLIDKDWKVIDDEIWRHTDQHTLSAFYNKFQSLEDAEKFLQGYFVKAAMPKREVIRAKIQQGIELDNKKRVAAGLEPNDINIPESRIDDYIMSASESATKEILGVTDESIKDGVAKLGDLNFLRERLPADTSMVVKAPYGGDFSFDNDLRDFRLDNILMKNANRFAGEAAIKNVFEDTKALEGSIAKVQTELQAAVNNKDMNAAEAAFQLKTYKDTLDTLRGFRTDADVTSQIGAVGKILQNLAYAKNGALMGFAQLGEVSGSIAYGGVKQMLNVIPALGEFLGRARKGVLTDSEFKDAEMELFGQTLEPHIWSTSWGDVAVRNALTEDSLINNALIKGADWTHNLGKVTSTLNYLPKMTDSMVRGMRRGFLGDCIRWADGETFSSFRNPFSPSKLKAARISPAEAETMKQALQQITTKDASGKVTDFDWKSWQKSDPKLFSKWYVMANNHAERAILSGTSIGNKGILKDMNAMTKILFQFKDYSGRAWNGQTMRAMTSRDGDDAIAALGSIVTNTAAYAARSAAVVAATSAVGGKAQDLADQYFDVSALARAAMFRSAIIGTPLSFLGQDVYSALTGASSIRTTQDYARQTNKTDRNIKDILGDTLAQIPALREAGNVVSAIQGAAAVGQGKGSERDVKNILRLLPLPNMIPIAQLLNTLPSQMGYPEKRPK